MTNIRPKVRINFEVEITLTEPEAMALDGLAGYGIDAFLKVFYEKMGRSYLEQHAYGLRSLFKNIQNTITPTIKEIRQARTDIGKAIQKRREKETT